MEAIDFVAGIDFLVAGLAVPIGCQNLGRRSSLVNFAIASIPLIGTEIWWAMTTEASTIQRITVSGVVGALCGGLLLIGTTEFFHRTAHAQSEVLDQASAHSVAPPVITGSGTTVVSIGQTGGVTAGTYINQAVMPELRVLSQNRQRNSDGTYTTILAVQVSSQITPANLHLTLRSSDLLGVQILSPPQNGVSMIELRNVVRSESLFSADVPNPYGTYTISVNSKSEAPINLESHF